MLCITTGRSVLQPTPLVVALSKKLMNQLASQADVQNETTLSGENTENGLTSIPGKPDRESERIQPADDVKVMMLMMFIDCLCTVTNTLCTLCGFP